MTKIAILDDYQNVALDMADWSSLPGDGNITVFNEPFGGFEQAASALGSFDIICIMRERTAFPLEMFESLPQLKLLVTSGMRNAAIDLDAARACGVTVCGTESPAHATVELTWGLILSLTRNIPTEERNMREGRWQTTLGTDIKGKVLGVIGLGRLGSQVAMIGKAFGMEVIAWSQNLTEEHCAEIGVRRAASKEELLRTADVMTIHLKYSERTHALIGTEEFALMKPTAFLVNNSRGPIIDEDALMATLNAGTIGGAAIDVYSDEPMPANHPMRSCPNCVITPHIGYVTAETYRIFYGQSVDAVKAYLAGAPIRVLM